MIGYTESLAKRTRLIHSGDEKPHRPVIYWMSRDQRAFDNHALLFAIEKAQSLKAPIGVLFCLVDDFLDASDVHFYFMLKGLKETEGYLRDAGIPLFVIKGNPETEVPKALNALNISALVVDFDPLKIKKQWKKSVCNKLNCPVYEVDAHNIVPCFLASDKAEYSAFTFRKKIASVITEFLTDFPPFEPKVEGLKEIPLNAVSLDNILHQLFRNLKNENPLHFYPPGYKEGMRRLRKFIENILDDCYLAWKNNAVKNAESRLSPYIHFGQISAQRIAFEVRTRGHNPRAVSAFLEQLIIRRELADNFCYYNPDYDSIKGFPLWARQTLLEHQNDKREFVYTKEEFEKAKTHDEIWNCAQIELIICGKIHNYLRMYWGKKILEWSADPSAALEIGNYLNNKYALDGRDPNGYVGVAWCVGGVHDRPFMERPVYGKIRPMGVKALERNFDVKEYVRTIQDLAKVYLPYVNNQ
jgi:deoxyribodipyrimidine photo-lyase